MREGPGVGMPEYLYLEQFGALVIDAFGVPPYLVGSALKGRGWNDIDVRLILDDADYERLGLGEPKFARQNAKWNALVLAFSALARQMTGLPVDFQIQQMTRANEEYKGERSALGIEWRLSQGLKPYPPPQGGKETKCQKQQCG